MFDRSGKLFERPWRAAGQMPGLAALPLTCGGFWGRAHTCRGWTDLRALRALDEFFQFCDLPFSVARGFSTPAAASPHGSGVSFDLTVPRKKESLSALRACAVRSGLFYRVDPEYLSPCCVHVDCLPRETLRAGDAGVFVCVLQDALLRAGYTGAPVSGVFSEETRCAVLRLQRRASLPETGIVCSRVWHAISVR